MSTADVFFAARIETAARLLREHVLRDAVIGVVRSVRKRARRPPSRRLVAVAVGRVR